MKRRKGDHYGIFFRNGAEQAGGARTSRRTGIAGNAFEDEETFDELPVPSASHSAASPTVETPSSPAFDADDGAEELAEMNGDDASEAADTDGEDAR